jgi:hypothetical protein
MPFSFTSGKWHFTRNPTELLSNPFSKRKVTTKTDNYSKPATPDWMAKAPRGARGKQVIRKRTGFPKRQPVKRTSSKRKRLAPRGKFKKPKKVRKIGTKYHKHRYEQEGTCNASSPYMYVNVNSCFKRTAIWDAMADALLRPILAKEFKFRPMQDTDKIGPIYDATTAKTIIFDFKRVNGTSGATSTIDSIDAVTGSDALLAACRLDVSDVTYDVMRTRMSYLLQYWADAGPASGHAVTGLPSNLATTVAPSTDTVAYFPYRYYITCQDSGGATTQAAHIARIFEHVGDTVIDLTFSQKIMFVNRTLAEGGSAAGQDLDRLGTNPLKGMLYQFNHSSPRLNEHVDVSDAFRLSIQGNTADGIDKITSGLTADTHLSHPLSAKYWLKNCVKETSIMLQPGQTKSLATVHAIKGKLSTIIERFYFSGFDKGTFGACSMFMFDMVHKSDQTPSLTYKRNCLVQSAGQLKSPKLYIPDFEAATLNL